MKRLTLILLCICGCSTPVNVTVNVPGRTPPDFSGSLLLLGLHAGRPVMFGSATVVAQRDGWWWGVTCNHNVGRTETITVDGEIADVWVEDAANDLALVRWKSKRKYPVYAIGTPHVGQTVWCPGWTATFEDAPQSMRPAAMPLRHVRRGVVSWVGKNSLGYDGGAWRGFSGAPLLNDTGELLGIGQKMHPPLGLFLVCTHPRHVQDLLYTLP
jgi:hypothetical protein